MNALCPNTLKDVIVADLVGAKRSRRRFSAVISLENVGQPGGFRVSATGRTDQLILRFADLAEPLAGHRIATRDDLDQIIQFARRVRAGSLLIHCNSGISRSTAGGFAVFADRLGPGREAEALDRVIALRPAAIPNLLMVSLADRLLGRSGAMIAALLAWRDRPSHYHAGVRAAGDGTFHPGGLEQLAVVRDDELTEGNWISARVSRVVPAPVTVVFEFIANPANDPQWIDAIGHVRQINEGPIAVGTRFAQTAVGPIGQAEVVWEVVELLKDRKLVGRSVAGSYTFFGGYECEPASAYTRVTKFASFRRTGMLLAVPSSLGELLMRRQFDRWLLALCQLARRW